MTICYEQWPAAVLAVAFCAPGVLYAQASVLTWHNDNFRSGQNLQERTLTPANVNVSSFGKLFQIGTDGKVDAQPLYVPSLSIPGHGSRNVLYVMTEHATAYAFDADSGAALWSKSLLGANETPSDNRGCSQVTPEIGIAATPVIDLESGSHGTIYVVAMSRDASGNYHQRLHALDLTSAAEQFGGPIEIQATYPRPADGGNRGLQIFDPKQYEERAALLLANGVVYTSWTSHCDFPPYTSWLIGYNEMTLAQTAVLDLTPNGTGGGIWGAGAGPAADGNGNVYLLTGNGTFDTTLNGGFPAGADYGNAFVKVSGGAGALVVADYFTMSNSVAESAADADLGSGGAILLPPLHDAQGHPRDLVAGAGKDGHIYVVDRNNMGKFNPNGNSIYQQLSNAASGGIFSTPAWFNGNLYYAPAGGRLKRLTFANGVFGGAPAAQPANGFPYPGATPSISANGGSNGIVWAVENSGSAVLHAYDAGTLNELYNSSQAPDQRDAFGAGNKFIVPTIANGKAYVGTTNGVGVFGPIATATPPPPDTITSPTSGSFLSDPPVTFCWTDNGNYGHWLDVGTVPGSGDLYGGAQPPGTSCKAVNNMLENGRTVYVKIWSSINGMLQFLPQSSASYTAPLHKFWPPDGTVFTTSGVTFSWAPVPGAEFYWLDVGPVPGNGSIFGGQLSGTTQYVRNIPPNGSQIWARLWAFYGGALHVESDHPYTACTGCVSTMMTPPPSSVLTSSPVQFCWTSTQGADHYWLDVGTAPGQGNLYAADQGTATCRTVPGVPATGIVHVQLLTHTGGEWQPGMRYQYLGANSSAQILTPPPDTVLQFPVITFTWNAVPDAAGYWLDVGTGPGTGNLYAGYQGTATSQTVSGIPSGTIWVRLWTYYGGIMVPRDFQYRR